LLRADGCTPMQLSWAWMLRELRSGASLPGAAPHPYAAPARADDLAGFPPTLIVTAARDLFEEFSGVASCGDDGRAGGLRTVRAGYAPESCVAGSKPRTRDMSLAASRTSSRIGSRRDWIRSIGPPMATAHRRPPP
jgi:acetyl esterase/lipase